MDIKKRTLVLLCFSIPFSLTANEAHPPELSPEQMEIVSEQVRQKSRMNEERAKRLGVGISAEERALANAMHRYKYNRDANALAFLAEQLSPTSKSNGVLYILIGIPLTEETYPILMEYAAGGELNQFRSTAIRRLAAAPEELGFTREESDNLKSFMQSLATDPELRILVRDALAEINKRTSRAEDTPPSSSGVLISDVPINSRKPDKEKSVLSGAETPFGTLSDITHHRGMFVLASVLTPLLIGCMIWMFFIKKRR